MQSFSVPGPYRFVAVVCVLGFVFLEGCSSVFNKYESAEFTVLKEEDGFEIRSYAAALEASAAATDDNSGFRKIFRYISGENSSGESIAMTVPVRKSGSGTDSRLSFFMPRAYDRESLPQPLNEEVSIDVFEEGTFAVTRFSGIASARRVEEARLTLRARLKEEGYIPAEEWFLDRYDPPWTLPFLRTNEVLIRLIPDGDNN